MIPTRLRLRPALPTGIGNVDYQSFQELLERMNELMELSGIEERLVQSRLEKLKTERGRELPGGRWLQKKIQHSGQAVRCMIPMKISGEKFRTMSRPLAECPLFPWFCGLDEMGTIRVPGKSTLQRYPRWVSVECIPELIDQRVPGAHEKQRVGEGQRLKLNHAVELQTVWMDTTARKANIPFPVDRVLLRDGGRT